MSKETRELLKIMYKYLLYLSENNIAVRTDDGVIAQFKLVKDEETQGFRLSLGIKDIRGIYIDGRHYLMCLDNKNKTVKILNNKDKAIEAIQKAIDSLSIRKRRYYDKLIYKSQFDCTPLKAGNFIIYLQDVLYIKLSNVQEYSGGSLKIKEVYNGDFKYLKKIELRARAKGHFENIDRLNKEIEQHREKARAIYKRIKEI